MPTIKPISDLRNKANEIAAAEKPAAKTEKQLVRLADHSALGRIPAEDDIAKWAIGILLLTTTSSSIQSARKQFLSIELFTAPRTIWDYCDKR